MALHLDLMTSSPLWGDIERWQHAFAQVCDTAGCILADGQDAECAVMLADDTTIQSLNNKWRGKNSPTNVLSFPTDAVSRAQGQLGDIILSYETLERESLSQNKELTHHARHLFLHGLLHLYGYDHETEAEAEIMEALEHKILLALGDPAPYEGEVQGGTQTRQ